jgi:hypothetical protein
MGQHSSAALLSGRIETVMILGKIFLARKTHR